MAQQCVGERWTDAENNQGVIQLTAVDNLFCPILKYRVINSWVVRNLGETCLKWDRGTSQPAGIRNLAKTTTPREPFYDGLAAEFSIPLIDFTLIITVQYTGIKNLFTHINCKFLN
ncbi:hypothetical protein R1flu_012041 [Riccia fluitans]|uniref:Uncharacterized protein n=1 Tax=Riccia fluitans TaxID=41844 RepID=A0ABD1ZAN3_9MARC